jgi:2-keto-4-pentenoate hydratase/2-oxohepta-3-ene-1,7-dioic acid hydratase in catechol pathway
LKLLRYQTNDGAARHGLLIDGAVFPLPGMTTTTALDSLREGGEAWNRVMDQPSTPITQVELLPPVENPGAYLDFYTFEQHVKTARRLRGLDMAAEWYQYPAWYNGSTRCFSGDNSTVVFPDGENKKDYELELAIVIRKKCFKAGVGEAADYIGGYTILNDFSARELQEKIMKIGLGPAKAKDFNTGLGPWLVTPDEIGDPKNLRMRAWVNGELWSDGNSGSAHYSFAQMIAFASEYQPLFPGDILAGGTVGTGCGLELGRFLKTGDRVVLEIQNIGRLTHRIG